MSQLPSRSFKRILLLSVPFNQPTFFVSSSRAQRRICWGKSRDRPQPYLFNAKDLKIFYFLLSLQGEMHCSFTGNAENGQILYHRLINYIDTKAKCRHLKNWSVKGLCGRCFIRVYRLNIKSVMLVFSTQLCKTIAFSMVQLSPNPPSLFEYILYTHVQCVEWGGGGVWGSRPQTDEHLPQSPFTGNF